MDNGQIPEDIRRAIEVAQGGELASTALEGDTFPISAKIARIKHEAEPAFKPGTIMPDGTIYIGFYNKKDWYAAATDALDGDGTRLKLNFQRACIYAMASNRHDYSDWMVPPGYNDGSEPDILHVMYENRDEGGFKGTFATGNSRDGWYWSSTWGDKTDSAWQEGFSVKHKGQIECSKLDRVLLRCVRAVPRFK